MIVTKGNVRYLDELIEKVSGIKPIGVFRYALIGLKRYHRYVAKKFTALKEDDKRAIEKIVKREKRCAMKKRTMQACKHRPEPGTT